MESKSRKTSTFQKCTGSSDAKKILPSKNFDNKLRYSERSFLQEQQNSIEKSAKFGFFLKKLPGNSKKSKTSPMKIKNPDGSTSHNIQNVLNK